MEPMMYDALTDWYRLIDPPGDHRDECECFAAAFRAAIEGEATTLLELGAGAGHNALFLKRDFRCTLSDPSGPMLALSRALNPDAEHVAGDMRTLRLGRTFDAVLVHDAVVYMTTEADLRAAMRTAFVHTRVGGAAIFAPDCVRETFSEATTPIEGDDGARSLRGFEWTWDPDPTDTSYQVEYVFALREGVSVRTVHDQHMEGLFPRATWARLLAEVGFEVDPLPRPIGDGEFDEVFLARRAR